MKTLIIPDIHLKPYILERATEIINTRDIDRVIFLGDYFDDWGKRTNTDAYFTTIDTLRSFVQNHSDKDLIFLLGNHDVPYLTGDIYHYTSLAPEVHDAVRKFLLEVNVRLATTQDGILISHAGYIKNPKDEDFEPITKESSIRRLRILDDDPCSGLWIRPERFLPNENTKYSVQIVGHTPVKEPTRYTTETGHKLILLDTFSTTRDGESYGNKQFGLLEDGKLSYIN